MDCCNNSGSRVHITVGDEKYSIRAAVTVRPGHTETEAGANQDGSMHISTKPVLAEMDIVFSDRCGLTVEELQNNCINITAVLIDLKRTYLFTRAALVGRAEINTENGEISGIKVCSPNTQQIDKS